MDFGINNALASPYNNYAAGSYDAMPMSQQSSRSTPEWLSFLDEFMGAVDKGFDIYERIDYPSWRRAEDALALERERRLREEAKADQQQAQAGTPGWVWAALGVGGVAAVLLLVKMVKE